MMSRLHLFLFFLFYSPFLFSQTYHIKRFGEKEGLADRFIYSLDQDSSGYLMIGTGKGVYRFDGVRMQYADKSDGLGETFVSSSLRLSNGEILYADYYGTLQIRSKSFISGQPKGFRDARILAMVENKLNLWVLLQDGRIAVRMLGGEWRIHDDLLSGSIPTSMIRIDGGHLLVGTDFGLVKIDVTNPVKPTAEWISAVDGYPITSLNLSRNGQSVFIGTDEFGVHQFNLKSGLAEEVTSTEIDLSRFLVNDILETNSGSLWIATNRNGAYRLTDRKESVYARALNPDPGQEFEIRSVSKLFMDREENIWLATKGGGLILLTPDDFSFYNIGNQFEPEKVRAMAYCNSDYWLGTDDHLYHYRGKLNQADEVLQFENGLLGGPFTSLCFDSDSNLWVGTEGQGLFCRKYQTTLFESIKFGDDQLSKRVNKVIEVEDKIMVATDFGIYIIRNGEVAQHLSMQSGLPHNRVRTLFRDSNDRIFIGTQTSSITLIFGEEIMTLSMPFGDRLIDFTSFAEDSKGRIWIGTDGVGMVVMEGDKITSLNSEDGLLSDYCYLAEADQYGQMWVGHRGGMSRIDMEDFVIEKLDDEPFSKLDFINDKSLTTPFGDLLFGTTTGLLIYHGNNRLQKHLEPSINLRSVVVGDSIMPTDRKLEIPFNTYRVEFNFIGITFKDPEEVKYSYFLDGYDLDWSEPSSSANARYNRLEPGDYTFQVKAYHENGVGGERIASIEMIVSTPFWQKWWFYVFSIAGSLLVVWFFVNRRERLLRANQEYLQIELDARTKEVVEQKELLEIKNKDITDSILYAKNIQRAMLPDPSMFERMFPESFVFYRPRDIVSGDFYWIFRHESKVIVACADCTGHGVPGAFMSMIGTVILKDVSFKPTVLDPAAALMDLNTQITELLHNKHGNFAVDDGMDISISEYDYRTGLLRTSSAKRPILVYQNGECIEIKGDRHSIGGDKSFDGEKSFSLHTIQLNPGDCFYHFTDGLPDQFGGDEGKKLKKSGLMKLLGEINHLEMQKQQQLVHKFFINWKGEYNQVDDILLFGIRV